MLRINKHLAIAAQTSPRMLLTGRWVAYYNDQGQQIGPRDEVPPGYEPVKPSPDDPTKSRVTFPAMTQTRVGVRSVRLMDTPKTGGNVWAEFMAESMIALDVPKGEAIFTDVIP